LGVEKRLRKGISEMLAMVLGIAITIAIGVALFTMLPNYITSMSQQQRIAVTSLSANKINSTAIMLVLTIKNLGSKDVSDADTQYYYKWYANYNKHIYRTITSTRTGKSISHK
jgi:Kef-type K+ transport system membrane component KefB